MTAVQPQVTVLMPVYNGAAYLAQAIESIVQQTFTDFEFLIIDDGSSDGSVDLIRSWRDPRLRLVRNERNLGLVRTLNKGLDLAVGRYIARMDCDDVSLPRRLELQVRWLESRPRCAVVATRIGIIDGAGTPVGVWPEDARAVSARAIAAQLPRSNCLAHPSVMLRADIARSYRFRTHWRYRDSTDAGDTSETNRGLIEHGLVAEDYDLWLRLCAAGQVIEKLDETLLFYRTHPQSVSQRSDLLRPQAWSTKDVRTRLYFIGSAVAQRRVNRFHAQVARSVGRAIVVSFAGKVKRALRRVRAFPGRAAS